MAHEDGPIYYPVTATVSLGGHTVLDIYRKDENGAKEAGVSWRILQEPRSLLVTTASMYTDTLHAIAELETDLNLDPDSIANWDLLGDLHDFEIAPCIR